MARVERDLAFARQQGGSNAESAVGPSASRPRRRSLRTRTDRPVAGGGAEIGLGMDAGSRPSGASLAARRARAGCRRARPKRARGRRRSTRSRRPMSRSPAVSISRKGTPPSATGASIRSRVVPGMAEVIAASRPTNALRRLDFPAFGGPAMTTRTPSLSRSAGGRASQDGRSRRASASSRAREIGREAARHRPRRKNRAPPRPGRPARAIRACQAATCRLSAPPASASAARRCDFGLGLEQVGQPLGLGEVDPAVLEGAAGELAGLGRRAALRSGRAPPAPRRPPRGRHGDAARRHPRRSRWPGPGSGLSAHYQGLRHPIAKRRERRHARLGQRAGQRLKRRIGLRPADPHQRDRRRRRARGQSEDRVASASSALPAHLAEHLLPHRHAGLVHRPPGLHHVAEHFRASARR